MEIQMNASGIATDPDILAGKPHVEGTRLSVDFLQSLLATGWSRDNILDTYPYLKAAELDAALNYKNP